MNPFALRHKLIFVLLMMSLSCPLTGAWAAGRQQLYGHIPKALVTAPRVGSVDPSTPLNLVLSLPLRNNAELQELLKRLYDPLSPEYRHFLTPEQFDAEFGPAEADYRALTAFALSHHLAVVATRPSHRLLEVSGTVGDIQKAFHVGLSHYQRPDGSLFYAPENEPSIDLDVPVLHVGGLDNYQVPKPMLKASAPQEWVGKPKSGFPPKSSFPAATASAGSAPAGLYWGTDFRNAYVPGICLTGNGQTVALIEFEGYYASDIQGYETLAGLPNVPLTNVLIDGYSGTPDKRNDANGIIEASLDIEMAISMAPGLSQVRVYEVKDTAPVAAADMMLDQIATDGKTSPINQISCSWTGFGDTTSETYFEQFATQGQSFFQAAGDDGAYVTGDPETTIPSPINFSSNIEMTVVGGTELTMNGASYQSETTWNAPLAGVTYGGGGGICSQVPIPTYQQDVNMTANGGSTVLRNIPDVSMVAYNIFVVGDGSYTGPTKYSYYTVVGTSAATPLWAGFLALANEQGAAGGVTVGFANPALYAIGMGGNYSSDFNDIRDSSTNNLSGNANLYKAIPGYDLATGWGSPTGQNLINGLTGLAASACSSSPTVTRTPTGTPTGAFTKTPINSPSNSPTPTPTDTATLTPTQTATKTPSSTATRTATNTITFTATFTPSPTPSLTGTPTPTGTPTKTAVSTATNTPSATATNSPTATGTATPSTTPTKTPTDTALSTSTGTASPSPSSTGTATTTGSATNTATHTPTTTPSATDSTTPTPSFTGTSTATLTATASPTNTSTATATSTSTSTASPSPSSTGTATTTGSATPTATSTPTKTPTDTPIATPTATYSATDSTTPTPSFTGTSTATLTATASPTNTSTATATSTSTSTASPSPSSTGTATSTGSATPTATSTPTKTPTQTPIATPTATYSATDSTTPTPSFTVTSTATLTATASPTNTPTATPTSTPTPTVSPTPSSTATGTPTATGISTATPTNSLTDTATPTATGTPTNTPTSTATSTATDSVSPTATKTATNSATETATFSTTATASSTASRTATNTSTQTATRTPTETPTSSNTPLSAETPTPTGTPTQTLSSGGPTPGWTVRPNISRGGAPIVWQVDLTSPSLITLSLYDLAGELVYQTTLQGNEGVNPISWDLENQSGQKVASGLYLFSIQVSQGFPLRNPFGKVLVLN